MAEDGEDDLKNAAPDRQDAVLEASWRALGRDLGGLGAFLGSKALRGGAAPQISKPPWKDEVFEEEESERVCKVVQHASCHLTTSGGGGLKRVAHSAGPCQKVAKQQNMLNSETSDHH